VIGSQSTDTRFRAFETTDTYQWRDRAQCRGLEHSMFFSMSDDPNATRPAKQVCAQCPVQSECLSFALETGQPAGVWGGLTTSERRRLLLRLYKQGWSRSHLPSASRLGQLRQELSVPWPSSASDRGRGQSSRVSAEPD